SHSVVVDKLDPNIAFACSQSFFDGGIFRTLDGGNTWTNISAQDPLFAGLFAFTDVDIVPRSLPTDPVVLYGCVGDNVGAPSNGIYRSINAAAPNSASVSWNLLIGGSTLVPGSGPGNIQISLSQTVPSTIYASIADRANPINGAQVLLGLYKSTDSGTNWQKLINCPNYLGAPSNAQGGYDNVVTVSPFNPNIAIMAGDGQGAFQSMQLVIMTTDGGQTFTDIGVGAGPTSPHTDFHAGAFDSTGAYLGGNDGGLFKRTFGATGAWIALNG